MKIAGFTFIRNAIKNDYPVVEAITSILPVCDEFVVALGDSDDETESLIRNINSPKIRIIHTVWDDTLRDGRGGIWWPKLISHLMPYPLMPTGHFIYRVTNVYMKSIFLLLKRKWKTI